eukprot:gene5551-3962_t
MTASPPTMMRMLSNEYVSHVRQGLHEQSFEDYFQAARRSPPAAAPPNEATTTTTATAAVSTPATAAAAIKASSVYNPYSYQNIRIVLICVGKLLLALIRPYLLVAIAAYAFITVQQMHVMTFLLLLMSVYPVLRHFYGVLIKAPFGRWLRPFSSRFAPGLYASPDATTQRLLSKMPSLQQESVAFGDLFDAQANVLLRATPWLLSGDIRTLVPFLTVQPPAVTYERRWIRVALSDHNGVCTDESPDASEAVALDWMPPLSEDDEPTATATAAASAAPAKAVFLLAGLTGGSQEGYVKDFVYHARQRGTHVFVMVGRGLQQCPLESDAMFHGARISDALACAKVIRSSLGADATLIAVGISMGGFVVTNALVKSALSEYVDGVVNVAGCFDTIENVHFQHSRAVWQPLLAFGLKEAFVGTAKGWEVVQKRFKPTTAASTATAASGCAQIIDRLVDVYDFDSVMVTGIHGYASVDDYYRDMSAAPAMRAMAAKAAVTAAPATSTTAATSTAATTAATTAAATATPLRFPVPLLVIHAIDDPVIHVNTMPADPTDAQRPWVWENEIMLLTAMGGHVGWPVGLLPWRHGFRFTNTIITDFLDSVHDTKLSPCCTPTTGDTTRSGGGCDAAAAAAASSPLTDATLD